ncbi:hypothetical protein [Klebsiella pneumoniae]
MTIRNQQRLPHSREQTYFVDKTPDHSENRLWMMANMGRVI